jgi:mono/diheme cytochrome c family protein
MQSRAGRGIAIAIQAGMSSSMSAPRGITGLQYAHLLRLMAMRQAVVFSAIAILLALSRAVAQNPAAPGPESSEGKKLFTSAGCAKCHDANGSKKLADGTTLLGRLSKVKDPEARLGTRLKGAEQRRQVFLYLKPLIERERLSGTPETAREKAE